MRAFGLGCLWFGIKRSSAGDYAAIGRHHIERVRSILEGIPNINNIDIDTPDNFSFAIQDIEEDHDYICPIYPRLSIKFKLFLPKRIQDQLLAISSSDAGAENFDVWIEYGYDLPVVFVSYAAPEHYHRPSDAVVAVRKYLEQQFNKIDPQYSLNTLGPSPYHANFWLEAADNVEEGRFNAEDLSEKGDGYRSIKFKYKPGAEPEELYWSEFVSEMHRGVEFFYSTVKYRNDLMLSTATVEHMLGELIGIQTEDKIGSAIKRYFKTRKITGDSMISMLDVEMKRLQSARILSEFEQEGLSVENSFLSDDTKRVLFEQKDMLPIKQIGDLVKMFEERGLKSKENISVLISGIFGGTVGAIIAALFK